ncbi:MAG TPA: glutamine-hydrolyzing GMP synthase [Acidobacteria bacterium]|nr:glutamine-hydrolyzing GMP synthase [Acidobacteriota bacterium]
MSQTHETIVIVDFGSQVTQLIARRVREAGVYAEIVAPAGAAARIAQPQVRGVILSGGPSSVYDEQAPDLPDAVFATDLPILGICYGMQLLVHRTGGRVESATEREFGRAEVLVDDDSTLLEGWPDKSVVWMSHGDSIVELPAGMRVIAHTASAPYAAVEDRARRRWGVQFHPEVRHTLFGAELLRNFALEICGCRGDWSMAAYEQEAIEEIRSTVGPGEKVVCALSGGVDSSVMALLIHKAIGSRLVAVFVDNGLLRKDEAEHVVHTFRDRYHLPVEAVDARDRFLGALAGVTDPEEKRRRIGHTFIEVFDEVAGRIDAGYLAQGTIYPDRIESASTGGPSATIKTHHNVGGLPERMKLSLIEPLRWLFKDEVRRLGEQLGLDPAFVRRHPFPGPGLAVRIVGEITAEQIAVLQEADAIFREELETSGWMEKTSQAFAVLLPVKTVGVMGDGRTYEQVVALRSVDTDDFMTADWSRLPHDFLARVATRIVGEVRGVNRVVYDITSKPPGTIEWL